MSLDPKDFPQLPLGVESKGGVAVEIAAAMLREMIDKTLFAVSTDETRFNLFDLDSICHGRSSAGWDTFLLTR